MLNNSKHYDLFLNPIHYYQTYIVCCMSITINGALIYVILCKPHQKIGSYKYILLSFAAFDISYSIVDAMTKPAIHFVGACFLVMTAGGPFAYPAPWGAFGATLFCTFFSISFTILAVHFVYRYISTCHVQFMFLFTRKYAIIWFIAVTVLALDYGLTVWFTMYPTEEIYDITDDGLQKLFNISSRDLGFIGPLYYTIREDGSYDINWRDSLGCINLVLIEMFTLDTILFCGYQVHKNLNKFSNMLSDQTRALQRQLFTALLVQTFIPLFFSYIPCWINFVAPVFQMSFEWLSNGLMMSALMYFPVADSLAILYFVKDFRMTLIEKVGKLFGVKITNNVSDSHVVTSGRVPPNPNQECEENG